MKKGFIGPRLVGLLAMGLGAGAAQASSGITLIHLFQDGSDGYAPRGRLVMGNDGELYGTSSDGGGPGGGGGGVVFKMANDGSGFTALHNFTVDANGNTPDGIWPLAGLTLGSDGNLYGTTSQKQQCVNHNCSVEWGTFFRITPAGTLTTIYTGVQSGQLVEGSPGLFYGTDAGNGFDFFGDAYSLSVGGDHSVLATFGNQAGDGQGPNSPLAKGNDGNFYGTTSGGGASSLGSAFVMTPTGAVTMLHSFSGVDGSAPSGPLITGADGNFYGGTRNGGAYGFGTVFRMTPDGTVTTLHSFTGMNNDGAYGPIGGLVQGSDGTLYGATPAGSGTLFRIKPDGSGFQNLHQFDSGDGEPPATAPVFGSDGRLYGAGWNPAFANGDIYAFDLTAPPQSPKVTLTKTCVNELDLCGTGINTVVAQEVILSWNSINVSSCTASGAWSGSKAVNGSLSFITKKPGVFVYKLACTGPNGTAATKVTLTVGRL